MVGYTINSFIIYLLNLRGLMARLFRILTAIIIISAIGIGLSYAETIWEKRQKAINPEAQPKVEQKAEEITEPDTYNYDEEDIAYDEEDMAMPAEQAALDPTDPFNITVPAAYGTIIDSNKGTNGNLIICIQDAHANYEAQKNISAILEELMRAYGITLILREGGITDKDFTYLRKEASLEARINASEKLLKNSTITGIDYVNLTTDLPMHIQGIEDRQLYDENRYGVADMDKIKDVALDYVNKMSDTAEQVKTKIYSSDLLALDKAKKDYENETTDLLGYYRVLNDIVQKKNISISEFNQFQNLMKIDGLEKKIDFAKINSDSATDEQNAVYKEYQESLKNLNVNKLFKEEIALEDKIGSSISENSDQKSLIRVSRALSIMAKMLKIKLVPEEYSYFLQNKSEFRPEYWADLLKKKSDELKLNLNIPSNSYAVADNLEKIEKFFGTARERDKVFVKKSEDAMAKDNVKVAALVAGGFHTPELTSILTDAGYSYVVISPRVTTPTDDNLYRESLKGEWLPEK